MPISTNAPFNEFGQSQILRDIEQLYMALNAAGAGGSGDGQTQDQSSATSQDLSALATIEYVDAAIAGIPPTSFYELHAFGNISPSIGTNSAAFTSTSGNAASVLSGASFTAPMSGVFTFAYRVFGTWSGAPNVQIYATITRDSASVPLKATSASSSIGNLLFTVSGVAPVWSSYTQDLDATAVWTGMLTAGETVTMTHYFSAVSGMSNTSNRLLVSGICQ